MTKRKKILLKARRVKKIVEFLEINQLIIRS